jgi:hypothetical protein
MLGWRMPDPMTTEDLDYGHVKEGVVEIDPMTGRMTIRSEANGGFEHFDVQEALTKYRGEMVRVVIAPFSTINRLAQLVENGSLPLAEVPTAGHRQR